MLTPILDFALVHADLVRTRTCGDVKRAIGRALRIHSCVVDLHEANQCRLALQRKLDARAKADGDDATEAALLATAVQLYARATSTSLKDDGDRGSFRIEDALKHKPEQLSDHQLLLVLRSRVFAHVYENEEVDVSCPLLSGPSTMTVWIKEGTTNAFEEAQARRDHRQAA